jgi:large subunit ribosomal protein L32
MAVPKGKRSRSRRGARRAHQKIQLMSLTTCPQCKTLIKPHTACSVCGTYKGVQVIDIDRRKKRKKRKEGKEKEKTVPGQK